MSGIMNMFVAAKTTVAAAVDEFFNRVTLLLNTGSTNGAQNNTFLDSSSNGFSITRNGNTTQGTFTPFSQTGWSNFFDGTDDYFTVPYNIAFAPASGDFTVEAWVYFPNALGTNSAVIMGNVNQSTGNGDWVLFYRGSTSLRFEFACSSSGLVAGLQRSFFTITPVAGTWYHIAGVKSGSTLSCYVNGVKGTDATLATVNNGSLGNYIGIGTDLTGDFSGYISNLRVVKGTAVYSGSSFSVPTTPLTAITNTSFLSCQSNRFIDNSSNAFTITSAGTPSVQAFSPFAPTASYDAAVVGGSGYFDGTGDCLTLANNAALQMSASDFTLEAWVYTASTANQTFMAHEASGALGFQFAVETNQSVTIAISSNGTAYATVLTSTSKLKLGQWNHIAAVRSGSGTGNIMMYINGVKDVTTGTFTGTMNAPSTTFQVGCRYASGVTAPLIGYLGGCRVIKGQALYTASTITIPDAPFTTTGYGTTSQSITGAVNLLINFTNAGIYNSASKNVLETVGNAQVSTTQAKWGTTSVYFDGTGDYLLAPYNKFYDLTQGDFTIEGWFYRGATGVEHNILNQRGASSGWLWRINSANTVTFSIQGTVTTITSTGTISANTWTHIAVARSGSNMRIFINGTIDGSSASTVNGTSATVGLRVGCDDNLILPFNGYMDDVRMTQGYARYTANFTAPTAAFPTQ